MVSSGGGSGGGGGGKGRDKVTGVREELGKDWRYERDSKWWLVVVVKEGIR